MERDSVKVTRVLKHAADIAQWVVVTIIRELSEPRRLGLVRRFVEIGQWLEKCGSLNSLMGIAEGLNHPAFLRLQGIKALLDEQDVGALRGQVS